MICVAELNWTSHGPAQTAALGEQLGRMLRSGDVICLEGDLGAGKTCLTQGIGRGLGVEAPITSPTFVLINEYPIPGPPRKLYHVDLYRVGSAAEAYALGIEDYVFGSGICVIEWAERVLELVPKERLWISMRYLDDSRRHVSVQGSGSRYVDLVESLRFACSVGRGG